MKPFLTTCFLALAACGSTRNSLGSGDRASAPGSSCDGPCTANVQCLPNGNCVVTCTGANGQRCETELSCNGSTCSVVRTDCPDAACCAAGGPACSSACDTPCKPECRPE